MLESVLPKFSSRSFIVSGLTFISLIHFEFIFVNGVRKCSSFILLQVVDQWKRSVFIPIPKKDNVKECSNYRTIALISHASKVMLKILQARLQQCVNHELPDVQAGFRKDRGTRDQIANICCIMEKARKFQKNIYFCFKTMPKPLTVWITINCGKF